MNNKLDEIGLALGNARVELNNRIVEFRRDADSLDIDHQDRSLISIARAAIEVHDLDDKWHDEELKEFTCHPSNDDEDRYDNPDHDGIEEDHDSLQNGMRW